MCYCRRFERDDCMIGTYRTLDLWGQVNNAYFAVDFPELGYRSVRYLFYYPFIMKMKEGKKPNAPPDSLHPCESSKGVRISVKMHFKTSAYLLAVPVAEVLIQFGLFPCKIAIFYVVKDCCCICKKRIFRNAKLNLPLSGAATKYLR